MNKEILSLGGSIASLFQIQVPLLVKYSPTRRSLGFSNRQRNEFPVKGLESQEVVFCINSIFVMLRLLSTCLVG